MGLPHNAVVSNTATPDWQSLFKTIQSSMLLEDSSSEQRAGRNAVLRAMYVDLGSAYAELTASDETPQTISIYADVVRMSADAGVVLDGTALIITARRIEVEEGAQVTLSYRTSTDTLLVIYADEIAPALPVVAEMKRKEKPVEYQLDTSASFGVSASYVGLEVLETLQAPMLERDSELHKHLTMTYHYAMMLIEQHPTVAEAMLHWIARCANEASTFAELGVQSSNLIAMAQTAASGMIYVPYLSRTKYEELAEAFVKVATAYEEQYEQFRSQVRALKFRKEDTDLLFKTYKITADYDQQWLDRIEQDVEQSQKAVRESYDVLMNHKLTVEQTATSFQTGLQEWEYEQRLKAALKIITGIIEVGTAIAGLVATGAAIVATGGAAAPAAAGTLTSITGTVNAITSTVNITIKAAEEGKSLADVIKTIVDVVEKVQKVALFIQQMVEISQNMKGDDTNYQALLKQVQETFASDATADDIAGLAAWDRLRLEFSRGLETAIASKVPNAREYQLQLDLLVVYGKTLVANQFRHMQTSQELIRLNLQKRRVLAQQALLKTHLSKLSNDQGALEQSITFVQQRYLDVKRSVVNYIKTYNMAHLYWALQPSDVKPDMLKPVVELASDLALIKRDYEKAVTRWDPPPVEISEVYVTISDPQLLRSFIEKHTIVYPIPLDHSVFADWDRVRVSNVRVWLDGVVPGSSGKIHLATSTSGIYQDRLNGKEFVFSASRLRRTLSYQRDSVKGSNKGVTGNTDKEFKDVVFVPTPFSEWTISLPTKGNENIDLTTLTGITLEFTGSALPGS